MKKSQMEIIGLAMIVVLISLALLFVIRFGIFRPTEKHSAEYVPSELVANFLNTLQDTNSPDCSGVKFSTLFQDCAINNNVGGTIPCNPWGTNSCFYIRDTMLKILNNSFDEWKIIYFFFAS